MIFMFAVTLCFFSLTMRGWNLFDSILFLTLIRKDCCFSGQTWWFVLQMAGQRGWSGHWSCEIHELVEVTLVVSARWGPRAGHLQGLWPYYWAKELSANLNSRSSTIVLLEMHWRRQQGTSPHFMNSECLCVVMEQLYSGAIAAQKKTVAVAGS